MTGTNYLLKFLSEKKCEILFDYPGNTILELYGAIDNYDVKHVTVRHEQGAVHAAEGYARASGKVGVCLATSGPGATNLVTGLCDAMLDSVPLLAITGQVDRSSVGHDAFQESDMMGITIPITKHNYLVKDPYALPTVLEEAWTIASTGRPGPVLVDIPRDVLAGEVADDFTESYRKAKSSLHIPHKRIYENSLDKMKNRVKSLLCKSYRPVILCGGGVVSGGEAAIRSMREFSSRCGIPIVYTLMGKSACGASGIEEEKKPLILGMAGIHGTRDANLALAKADLVCAVGCRFSDRTVPHPENFVDTKVLIHADIDAAELCKNIYSICPVVADSAEFFRFLAGESFSEERIEMWEHWQTKLRNKKESEQAEIPEDFEDYVNIIKKDKNSFFGLCTKEIGKYSDKTVFVTDVGRHQLIAATEITDVSPRGFITSGGLGTMGFGLPAAIGTLCAVGRDKRVVLLTGDGSFQMCMQELATLREICDDAETKGEEPDLKIFIYDNFALGLVEEWGKRLYGEGFSPKYEKFHLNFSKLASLYGFPSREFSSFKRFESSLGEIMETKGTQIIVIKA